jgi:PAS domain S-box-containing protein
MDYEKAYNQLQNRCKVLEESLAAAEEERDIYDQILRSAKRTVALINLNREIVWINNTSVKRFGYTLDEVKGKRISDLIFGPETDTSSIPTALEQALNGISTHYEHIVYKKNGEKFWNRAEMRPYYNSQGVIDKIIVYGLDITEEKEFKNRIQKAENRYNSLLDNSPSIICRTDLTGKILSVNETWTKLLGYTKEETINQNGYYYFDAADAKKIEYEAIRLIEGIAPSYNIDVKLKKKDGSWLFVNTMCIPVFSDTKEIVGMTGISTDITNEKNNEQLINLLFTQVADLICLHDSQTRYTFVSPSIKEIAGYEPEELLGKESFRFYHPDDLPRIKEYRERNNSGKGKAGESLTIRYLKKDGSYTWLELTGKTLRDEDNNITGAITSCKVANLRKQEEDKIQAALEEEKKLNQLKSSFLRFVTHEFKAPISIIRALVELIQMSLEDGNSNSDQIKKDVNGIEVEIKSLITLMEDVLVLEELESGDIKLNKSEVSLIELMNNVNERLPFQWRSKATIESTGKEKLISGDKKYIELILKNLISNAFKYSEGKQYPIVNLAYNKKTVTITIKDFGIGIPIESQEKLFTNFYRASNVGKIDGTGLGLSIVKKFVEIHGGKISFTSIINEGTEMVVTLPVY